MAADWSTLNIEMVGDSLTARNATGDMQPVATTGRVSDKLLTAHPTLTIHNDAIDGQKVSDLVLNASFGTTVPFTSPATDARIVGGKINILVCLIGTNNGGAGDTAAATYAQLTAYLDARIVAGWVVFVLTIPDRNISWGSFRTDYNAAIASGAAAKGYNLIDMGATVPFNDWHTLGYGDGTHFGDAAITAYSDLVDAKVEALYGSGSSIANLVVGSLIVG